MFDIIGDIHGHADELVALLSILGYRESAVCYRHPGRQAVFVGDFIDRGPQILEVLKIVRPMITAGAALAVMGNHEFNALAFHTPDRRDAGGFLRPHTAKNLHQHEATLSQVPLPDLASSLNWFRTLPLWLDLDGLRIVHACWDDELLCEIASKLPAGGGLDSDFLHQATDPADPLFHAVDVVLKGKEAELPSGHTFFDKDGHPRSAVRAKWYLPPSGHKYRTYALQSDPIDCDLPLTDGVIAAARPYPADAKTVFVGHYWLNAEQPSLLAPNVACVDYSVAKGGMLCAYRWDGERTLDDSKFVTVPSR